MTKQTTQPPQPPTADDGADEVWGDLFWSLTGKPPDSPPAAPAPDEPAPEAKPAGKPKKPGRQRRPH